MILIKHKASKMVTVGSTTNPNYEFVNVVDTDLHTDIHNIESLDLFGQLTGRDYNFVRNEIMKLILTKGGFDNLTNGEKYVTGKWICCTEAQALTVMSSTEYDDYVGDLVDQSYKSREKRRLAAKRELGKQVVKGDLTYDLSNQLDTDSFDIARAWVNANNPLFTDWIMGINDYSGSGFMSKPYATPERQQILIDKIISGSL